jgi:hypothetical protein
MDRILCYGSLAVALLMFVVFLVDFVAGIPFGGGAAFTTVDIFGMLASGVVTYLAYNAARDLK